MKRQTVDISESGLSVRELIARFGRDTLIVLMDGENYVGSLHLYDRPYAVPRRMLGMSAGLAETADDFDDPLPEGYWLGEAKRS
ncbi:MAG: hypothetical protein WBC44_19855 [Planctomycetaceae bacterium]